MPAWLAGVFSVLGDPRVISLAALGLAWWSFRRSGRLTSLQTRIADLELKNRERVEAAREKADVRARLSGNDVMGYRVIVENASSGAGASQINIRFLENDPIPDAEREEKLPIPELGPGERCPLVAGISKDCAPPFKIVLTWTDADGRPQRREKILYAE